MAEAAAAAAAASSPLSPSSSSWSRNFAGSPGGEEGRDEVVAALEQKLKAAVSAWRITAAELGAVRRQLGLGRSLAGAPGWPPPASAPSTASLSPRSPLSRHPQAAEPAKAAAAAALGEAASGEEPIPGVYAFLRGLSRRAEARSAHCEGAMGGETESGSGSGVERNERELLEALRRRNAALEAENAYLRSTATDASAWSALGGVAGAGPHCASATPAAAATASTPPRPSATAAAAAAAVVGTAACPSLGDLRSDSPSPGKGQRFQELLLRMQGAGGSGGGTPHSPSRPRLGSELSSASSKPRLGSELSVGSKPRSPSLAGSLQLRALVPDVEPKALFASSSARRPRPLAEALEDFVSAPLTDVKEAFLGYPAGPAADSAAAALRSAGDADEAVHCGTGAALRRGCLAQRRLTSASSGRRWRGSP